MAARLTLGGVRRALVREAFCEFFGIGEGRADLLVALYERQGKPEGWRGLRYGDGVPNRGAVQESISTLRSAMESEAIDLSEAGYFLTEIGLGECRAALKVMGKTLASVGAKARRRAA